MIEINLDKTSVKTEVIDNSDGYVKELSLPVVDRLDVIGKGITKVLKDNPHLSLVEAIDTERKGHLPYATEEYKKAYAEIRKAYEED